MNLATATTAHLSHALLRPTPYEPQEGIQQEASVAPISLTRLPARRCTRLCHLLSFVSLPRLPFLPLSMPVDSVAAVVPGALRGGGGGAGRSAAWAASGGRRAVSRVVLVP
jgi:hypothetical protein